MLISVKYKLAFLAVPKTGTTAIEMTLGRHSNIVFRSPPAIKHMTAPQFEAMMRPYLAKVGGEGVQTFALMRDPVDLLQSWYFYRRRLDDTKPEKRGHSTRDITLEQFIEARLSDDRPDFARVGNQGAFLCGRKALREAGGAAVRPLVDIIFPYERMADALAFLGARLGETVEVERKNTSQREKAEIAPALRARIEREMADDLALYQRVLAGEFLPGSPHAEARQSTATETDPPPRKRAAARREA